MLHNLLQKQKGWDSLVTPKLKCHVFDPDSLEKDKLAYRNFYKEFENCVFSVESKSLKQINLKNHLKGYAHKIISHLSISDANFDTAVEILEQELLDKNILLTLFSSLLMTQNPFKIRILNQLRCF